MRNKLLLIVGLVAILGIVGALIGGDEEKAEVTEATAEDKPSPVEGAEDSESAVEPVTDDERKWVRKISRIRPRIDKTFNRSLHITRATMQSLIRVLHSCKTTLKEAGPASDRFSPASRIAKRACARYEAAARRFKRAIEVSSVSGAVVVGTPEEDIFNRSIDHAFSAQGSASNVMQRAEEKADQILDQIEAETGS